MESLLGRSGTGPTGSLNVRQGSQGHWGLVSGSTSPVLHELGNITPSFWPSVIPSVKCRHWAGPDAANRVPRQKPDCRCIFVYSVF